MQIMCKYISSSMSTLRVQRIPQNMHPLQNEDEGGRKMDLPDTIPLSFHIATVSNSGDRLNTKQDGIYKTASPQEKNHSG